MINSVITRFADPSCPILEYADMEIISYDFGLVCEGLLFRTNKCFNCTYDIKNSDCPDYRGVLRRIEKIKLRKK